MSQQALSAPSSPWRLVAILSVAVAVLASLVALAFTWTSVAAEPDDIPVGIVATDQQYTALNEAGLPETMRLERIDDRTAARAEVAGRDLYGAIILDPEPEILTASAANTAISNQLAALAPIIQEMFPPDAGSSVTVTDLAPWAEDDPNGAGFAVAGLPIIVTGFLGGVAVSLLVQGRTRRLAAAVSYSIIVAGLLAIVLQGVLGILHGNAGINMLIIGLTAASGTMLISGLNSALGRIGTPLGVLFLLLLANPLAGFAIPSNFYPTPWGEVGQWLAPGASATLLRAESYFPEQDVVLPWLILTGWTALGALLLLTRPGKTLHSPEPESDHS